MSETKAAVLVYTEATPNPETLKFVSNQLLISGVVAEFTSLKEAEESEIAKMLFSYDYIANVFIANNFITITKKPEKLWAEIIPEVRQAIKSHIEEGKQIVSDAYLESKKEEGAVTSDDIDGKIKDLLEKYVRPAVEMDGGAIVFKSFDEGIVTLQLQGACSGCPSSTVTLKAGIEGMMKRMIPEVKEVIAEEV